MMHQMQRENFLAVVEPQEWNRGVLRTAIPHAEAGMLKLCEIKSFRGRIITVSMTTRVISVDLFSVVSAREPSLSLSRICGQ
jgi:hypothetical protein